MDNNRIFSEQEAAEIMQRAVRLQEQSHQSVDYTPGITVQELRKIALEAGIDASYIEKAIAGIDSVEKSNVGPFNLTEEFVRVVEGEINPDDFDKILLLFSHSNKNQLKQIGRSLTGHATTGSHFMGLSVESRNGRTKICAKYMPIFAYLIGLHGPLIASAILLATQIGAGRPWLGVGLAAGLLGIGAFVFRSLVYAGRKAVKIMTSRIAEVVEAESSTVRENLSKTKVVTEQDEQLREENN